MKYTFGRINTIIMTVLAIISPSAQGKRCDCHQCVHIPSEGRRCECCVYMLQGKKRSLETPTPIISDNYMNDKQANYVEYSTIGDEDNRGSSGLRVQESDIPYGREISLVQTLFTYLTRKNELDADRQKVRERYWNDWSEILDS